jgi:hypothetical protein
VVSHGSCLAEEDIYNQLRRIVNSAEGLGESLTSVVEEDPDGNGGETSANRGSSVNRRASESPYAPQESVGLLTAMHRHRWAAARVLLLEGNYIYIRNMMVVTRLYRYLVIIFFKSFYLLIFFKNII